VSAPASVALDILKNVRVASPCPVPWERMTGDDRVRHCGQCRLNVYNFSAMTAEEVAGLIEKHEGRLCGRFYRRADGTMITSDCPVGLAARMRRRVAWIAVRIAAAVLLAAGAFTYLRGGPAKGRQGAGGTLVEPLDSLHRWIGGPGSLPIAGEIFVPPPPAATDPGLQES
jgi:hypothetical protein